jgi:hypothetical protein
VTWDGLRRDRPFDRLSPMRVKPNNLGGFGRSLGWIGGARRKHEPKPGGDFPYIGSESVFSRQDVSTPKRYPNCQHT